MTTKINSITSLINSTTDRFVQARGNDLITFINTFEKIKNDYKKDKLNFCIINDLNQLYKNVCVEVNSYIVNDTNGVKTDYDCIIPMNPHTESGGILPGEGNYGGEIINDNIGNIHTLYKCYYTNTNISTNEKGLIHEIGDMYSNMVNIDVLQKVIEQIDKKKVEIEKKLLSCKLIEIPVTDLILLYKEACRHIKKLRGEKVDETKTPGPNCDILYGLPVINDIMNPNDTCGELEQIEVCDDFYVDTNLQLYEHLLQDFFNGQDGGNDINGCFLQILITQHYHEFINKIVCPIIKLFEKIRYKIICEKNKLIPFEVSDILDIDSANCTCNIPNCDTNCDTTFNTTEMDLTDCSDLCDECRNKKFIRIKKLFGTECDIEYLLSVVCIKKREIEEFYKQTFDLELNYDDTYISDTYSNPIILNGPIQITTLIEQITVFIKDTKNDFYITEDIVYNLYDMLCKCKLYLKCFLNNIEIVRNKSIETREIKDDKTMEVKDILQNLLDCYMDSTARDFTINVKSGYIDINLAVNYQRYLQSITLLRCKMVEALCCLKNILNQIDEEHNCFHDILVCSAYYKYMVTNGWYISDNQNKKIPKWLLKNNANVKK